MNFHPRTVDDPPSPYRGAERRRKPRIKEPFPVTVGGLNGSGEPFEVSTVLENISAGGLYLLLPHEVASETELNLCVTFKTSPSEGPRAARVAMHGRVRRVDPKPDGACGLGVEITRHRFF